MRKIVWVAVIELLHTAPVTDSKIYGVSGISESVVHGTLVGHQTVKNWRSKRTGVLRSPLSTHCMPTRILIAEDSPAVRTALRTLLEGAGSWEIIDVENGQQAVARAEELKPNLIILDLVMPVMDGLNAARQISKILPEIPLLMHTMHWSPQVELEAQKVGVRKVVPKVDSNLLIATIQELLAAAPSPPSPIAETATMPSPPILEAGILESGNATSAEKSDVPAANGAGDGSSKAAD